VTTVDFDQAQLDYWKDRTLDQAVILKANAAEIRRVIHETYPRPMYDCPEHGPKVIETEKTLGNLEDTERRVDLGRGILAMALNYLEFLRPESLAKVTPAALADWAEKIMDQADRSYRTGLDYDPMITRTPAEPAKPYVYPDDVDPLTGKKLADLAGRTTYYRDIALRQSEAIAGHAAMLAKYTEARDKMLADWAPCEKHQGQLEDLEGHVTRVSLVVKRTDRAYRIIVGVLEEILDEARQGIVPADLSKTAKRVNARAHKVWNP